MKKINNIVQSEVEPNSSDLWLKDGDLLANNGNGFELLNQRVIDLNEIIDKYYNPETKMCDIPIPIMDHIIQSAPIRTYTEGQKKRSIILIDGGVVTELKDRSNRNIKQIICNCTTLDGKYDKIVSIGVSISSHEGCKYTNSNWKEATFPVKAASKDTLGGVRIMDDSGLVVSQEGNLYVKQTDSYIYQSGMDENLNATIIAINKLAKKVDMINSMLKKNNILDTGMEVFD